MISTNTIKRRVNDAPQKLTVLTTNKVKPKTEADMLASAKLQIEALRPLVNARETRKHTGTMLTTANMEDRKLNEKRRALRARRKAIMIKGRAAFLDDRYIGQAIKPA